MPASALKITSNHGKISGSNGNYSIRITQIADVNITVSARGKNYPPVAFRVKRLPNPTASLAGLSGGSISKMKLMTQSCLTAGLPNTNIDVSFTITEFTATSTIAGFVVEHKA